VSADSFQGDSPFSLDGTKKEGNRTRQDFQKLKTKIHHIVVDRIDLDALQRMDPETSLREVSRVVEEVIAEQRIPFNRVEHRQLVQEIQHEMFGLGPLEPLLRDPSVNDILVNGSKQIYVERSGKLELTNISFYDEQHLRHIITRIVGMVGRRIDESSPMVDARLKDGSRVNAIIPPLAIDGSSVSIRKFKNVPLREQDLIDYGSVTKEALEILKIAIRGRLNVIVSGGTGTGKTTMLNLLSTFIPDDERIITVEDTAELRMRQPHVVRLETRPPNVEGKGEIDQRALVKNALRMRPDRIIVGEVRGAETLDMLQALNTGHDGSMATIHANTARDAISRLETLVQFAGTSLPSASIMKQIASAIHIILQLRRYKDGIRRVDSITEITGMEGDIVTMQEICRFKPMSQDAEGKIKGQFIFSTGRPKFFEMVAERGLPVNLPPVQSDDQKHWKNLGNKVA